MDEQLQAYVELITQLLNCSSGQEREILQSHQDLIDRGLLHVMLQEFSKLQTQGKEETAERLRKLIVQLTEYLSFGSGILIQNNLFESLKTSRNFLLDIFRCIYYYKNNTAPIDSFLTANQAKLNTKLLNILPTVVLEMSSTPSQEEQKKIADILATFGDRAAQIQAGQREINLELTIASYEQALKIYTPNKFPTNWAQTQHNLGTAYRDRVQGNRGDNLEHAIVAYQASLLTIRHAKIPEGWAMVQYHLGDAYRERVQGNRGENLAQAITAYQNALKEYTQQQFPVYWANAQTMVGYCYSHQVQGDHQENLVFAIAAYEKALQIFTPEQFPDDWAIAQLSLGVAYSIVALSGNRASNSEKAIAALMDALRVYTPDYSLVGWAKVQCRLGHAYSERVHGNRAENLEQAIKCCKNALKVLQKDTFPEEWALTQTFLGDAFDYRTQGNRGENIEQAITAYEKALTILTLEDSPYYWAGLQASLATVYSQRIQGDRVQNCERAIVYAKNALRVDSQKTSPLEWAKSQRNLGHVYRERLQGDPADNLEQAIIAYKNALQVFTPDAHPIEWAKTKKVLGEVYNVRSKGDQAENKELGLTALQQALQVFEVESLTFEWASTQHNLGNIYLFQLKGGWKENIQKAINAYEQALDVIPQAQSPYQWAITCSSLGNAYWFYYIESIAADSASDHRKSDTAYLEQALSTLRLALEVFQPDQFPNNCRQTASFLGDRYAENQNWAEAASAYQLALQAAENLYQSSLLRRNQEVELSTSGGLFRRAAFALAKVGNLRTAVLTLEQGRARGLSEALQRDKVDLAPIATLAPDCYKQYLTAANAVRQLESNERSANSSLVSKELPHLSQEQLSQHSIQVRQDFKAAIAAIRQLQGYEEFLAESDFEDIIAVLTPARPLVYLLSTPNGSLILTVHSSDSFEDARKDSTDYQIEAIWLDELTESSLNTILFSSGKEQVSWFEVYNNRQDKQGDWLQVMDQVTHQLWNLLMEPVVLYLESLNVTQAVLIPTGNLGLIPLHAAWTEDKTKPTGRRYALDTITFTYAPNARSLGTAKAVATRAVGSSLLAINEPRPIAASALPNSEREIEAAIAYFPDNSQQLNHEQASRNAVLAALPNHDVLHFSCHGFVNGTNPLESGLLMANNEILSLRDFFNLQLQGIRLAILSACETGLPGTELPDEVISLPTGLLQAGVAGVVASLWSVSDLSTMMLLVKFYDLWRNQGLDTSLALHQAQKWLRDSTDGEKADYFGFHILEPDARSFAHPFYWAAFSYVGV